MQNGKDSQGVLQRLLSYTSMHPFGSIPSSPLISV